MAATMRDENDWRPGDKLVEGPDWSDGFGLCHCCNKPRTWDEYWAWENDERNIYRRRNAHPAPVVDLVRRNKGNVTAIRTKDGGWYCIGPKHKKYLLNPACKNGGYRSSNKPDPKYQTDSQGRFLKSGRCSSHGG